MAARIVGPPPLVPPHPISAMTISNWVSNPISAEHSDPIDRSAGENRNDQQWRALLGGLGFTG
jgi:hypothetical protein